MALTARSQPKQSPPPSNTQLYSYLTGLLPIILRGSREENIYVADRDRDDSSIDMDFRYTCYEDRHNLRWWVCYHTAM